MSSLSCSSGPISEARYRAQTFYLVPDLPLIATAGLLRQLNWLAPDRGLLPELTVCRKDFELARTDF